MKPNKPLLIISVLFALLYSCTRAADDSEIQRANNQWLQNLVCAFPCWQNITPNETKFEDVVSILQDEKITVQSVTEDEISFVFEESIYGSVSKASDGSVDNIILSVPYEKLTLGDLEQIIGVPAGVSLVRDYTADCIADLLYPDIGTIIEIAGLENDSKSKDILDCQTNLNSDSEIYRIVLVSNNLDNSEFWKASSYSSLKYMKWKGYGTYP